MDKANIGCPELILKCIQCDTLCCAENPKLMRAVEGKELCDFKKCIAIKDKPVVNFIL